jgi:hypothetical protein
MKIKKIKTFTFEELSDKAKDSALNQFRGVHVDYFDWYHQVYDDANEIGIQITGFDIGRPNFITGKFNSNNWSIDCANKIIKNHGETCETYKLAQQFIEDYSKFDSDSEDYSPMEFEEFEEQFLQNILEEYLTTLKHDYDYRTSDEAVSEYIIDTEIVFDENGNEIAYQIIG